MSVLSFLTDCHYLIERGIQPSSIRLLDCASCGWLRVFPVSFQLLIKELLYNIVQGDIVFPSERSILIEIIFVPTVGYFKEEGRHLCSYKIKELVGFIHCSRFRSLALPSVVWLFGELMCCSWAAAHLFMYWCLLFKLKLCEVSGKTSSWLVPILNFGRSPLIRVVK